MTNTKKHLGIIYITLSAFCFTLMNIFVRLSGDLPSIQKSFFRNFVALFFALIILVKNHTPIKPVDNRNLKFFLIRAAAGTVGILGNFYAVDHLVLSDASMLNKLSPFFAVISSALFLKENVKPFHIITLLTAFAGAIFIIKPSFSNVDLFPAVMGFIGGMGAGAAYTAVRHLGQKGEHGPFIVFFFSVFSCLVTLPYLFFDYHPMSLYQVLCLLFAGLAASGGQFAITAAYCYAPAKEISVYDYSQVIFSAILGFFIFQQIPDGMSFMGYFLIIAAAVAMFIYNNRKSEG